MDSIYQAHLYSVYHAPRGGERLMALGDQISMRHLNYNDKLIGIVGESGSGKSSLIKGMFPGMSLSNDDDTIDHMKIMQMRSLDMDYKSSIYHIDMRFQTAFTQMYEIVDFVNGALKAGKRVIVEHFDLLYPAINKNSDILVGVGAEIIVTRPNFFGPLPEDIKEVVFKSAIKRRMVHTAEDLTINVIKEYFVDIDINFTDVRGGFAIVFEQKPQFKVSFIEEKVKEQIEQEIDICYNDETSIKVGDKIYPCSGPRIHVRNTREIRNFRLINRFLQDENGNYLLVGLCDHKDKKVNDLNKIFEDGIEEA